MAIIENLQREELNPIDKAHAFKQLNEKFKMTHAQIAKKMGKSREYISNALRLLTLPDYIQNAIAQGEISEGHARPLLMLLDRPDELRTLFQEITLKKLTVREAVHIARSVAIEKVRKNIIPPEIRRIEMELMNNLGTRVRIEQKTEEAGRIHIDFTNKDDLMHLVELVKKHKEKMLVPSVQAKKEAMEKLGASMGVEDSVSTQDKVDLQKQEHALSDDTNMESIESDIILPNPSPAFPDFTPNDTTEDVPNTANKSQNETETFHNTATDGLPEGQIMQNENELEATFPEPVKLAQDPVSNDIKSETLNNDLQNEVNKIMQTPDTDSDVDEKLHAFEEKIASMNNIPETSNNSENANQESNLYGIDDFSQKPITDIKADNLSSDMPDTPLSRISASMPQTTESESSYHKDDRGGDEDTQNTNINTV